jgi:hypothetical protein
MWVFRMYSRFSAERGAPAAGLSKTTGADAKQRAGAGPALDAAWSLDGGRQLYRK